MSKPARVGMSGPLSWFAPAFLEHLIEQGYRPDAAAKQLRLMADLSRWLAARELHGSDLTAIRVEEFLADRREGHRHYFSAKAINPLLEYLRELASPRRWHLRRRGQRASS
jgi:integrase/recombinase XerD